LPVRPPGFGGEFDLGGVAVVLGVEGGVELTAGVDALVGDADLFDLFEVKEARAVGEGVQGHDADGRGVAVEDGQGEHGPTHSEGAGEFIILLRVTHP
jgi:hypothetical protein